MRISNIKINISTRLLAYFLFVTIIPLFILALTSTILLHSSLNDKSTQDLNARADLFWKNYNNNKYKLKNLVSAIPNTKFKLYLKEYNPEKANPIIIKEFTNIIDKNNLEFALLFNHGKKLLVSKVSQSCFKDNLLIEKSSTDFKKLISLSEKSNLILSNEILNVGNFDNKNKINAGKLFQIAIYKFKADDKQDYYIAIGIPVKESLNQFNDMANTGEIALFTQNYNEIVVNEDYNKIPFLNKLKFLSPIINSNYTIINNLKYKTNAYPLENSFGEELGKIVIGIPIEYFDSLKMKNSALLLQVSILTAFAGIILAYILSKTITNPISRITDLALSVENGDLSKRLNIRNNDELGYLAQSFNRMINALSDRSQEIVESNRLLSEQSNKIEAIISSSADGIITIDSEWKISSINPRILEWTGLSRDEVIGKPFYQVIKYKPSNNSVVPEIESINAPENINQYYPNASLRNFNTQEVTRLDITYSEIKPQINPENSYVLILRDVTKKKELEQLKEDFVATLTHDLRVPIVASVQSLEQMLQGYYGELQDKQKFITQHLISSNKDLLRMVNTILDSYSYEEGKQALIKRKVNLNKLLDECVTGLKPLINEKRHRININLHQSLTEVMIDRPEIKRVIINLLSNAITYTQQEGSIEIKTSSFDNEVIVSISDNGPGIAKESQKELFQRYSKATNTLRKIGTGLGLYLSKQIIGAHSGKIWVESEKGEGSTFYFSLPIV